MNRFFYLAALLLCFCCSKSPQDKVLKVQASSVPQAEILEQIQVDLEQEGITLKILVIDDYNIPNRALADKEIDANFFQHIPFLQEQIKEFHYPICSLAKVHIEPMGIYSLNGSIKEGGIITLPSDPTNEERALLLLQKAGFITLKEKKGSSLTILDIEENPKNLRFKEIDAALLARTLKEVNASIIPTNYALLADLHPQKDAIFLEDSSSLYTNVVVIREEDCERPELLALKKALESEKVRLFIEKTYQGAVICAF